MSSGAKQVACCICVSCTPLCYLQSSENCLGVITEYLLTSAVVYSAEWPFLVVVFIGPDVSELEQLRLFRSHLQ